MTAVSRTLDYKCFPDLHMADLQQLALLLGTKFELSCPSGYAELVLSIYY